MTKITPVVLSGGSGTRLWPLSTPTRPKQFLALTGALTMFQQTVMRASNRLLFEAPIVVASAAHADLIAALERRDAEAAEKAVQRDIETAANSIIEHALSERGEKEDN